MTDQTERGAPNPNARREHLAERLRQIAESQRMDFDSPDVASTLDEAADALDATPAIDPDDEALVERVARLIAHSALDWTDYATGEHDHSPACSNWEAYTDDARAVLAEATS